jgi:hypothetical protein
MVRRLLLVLSIVVILATYGCLEMDRPASDGLDLSEWQDEEPSSYEEGSRPWAAADRAEPAPALVPDEMDLAVCEARAEQEQRCAADGEPAFDVTACATRFACSRRLWSTDLPAVYRCLSERSCEDGDPVMTCLREVGETVEPSAAEVTFSRELELAQQECGEIVEAAPRQADAIYEGLTFCLTENDDCDVKAACAELMLDALVDEICGEA